MRVDASGNVGIGTTVPQVKLDVRGSLLLDVFAIGGEEGIFFRNGFTTTGNKYNSSILNYDHNSTGGSPDGISINGFDGVSICTGLSTRNERMRVDGGGSVGIGTTNPQARLHVVRNGNDATYGILSLENSQSFGFNTGAGITAGLSFRSQWAGDGIYSSTTMGQINCVKEQNANYGDSYLSFHTRYTAERSIGGEGVLTEKMRITSTGNVGIGLNPAALYKLDVNGTLRIAGLVNNKLLVLYDENASENLTTGTQFYGFGINPSTLRLQCPFAGGVFSFFGSTTQYGYVDNGTGFVNTFTGQHRCFPHTTLHSNEMSELVGLIVGANGEYVSLNHEEPLTGKDGITISEAVPKVKLCDKSQDATVFGVVSDVDDSESFKDHYGSFVSTSAREAGNTRLIVNSIGEGAIWVCDKAGVIQNGDYITSCSVPGYGAKQAEPTLHNYTVAKITMNCDFSGTLVPKQRIVKTTITEISYESETVEEEIIDVRTDYTYDPLADCYVKTEVNDVRKVTKTVTQEYELKDATGNIIGNHIGAKKMRRETQKDVYDLDEFGNVQWENDVDEQGNIIMEEPYNMRFLRADGTLITKNDYVSRLANGEPVYRAAFVGCTYHCG
jgi:hypothetical protein